MPVKFLAISQGSFKPVVIGGHGLAEISAIPAFFFIPYKSLFFNRINDEYTKINIQTRTISN